MYGSLAWLLAAAAPTPVDSLATGFDLEAYGGGSGDYSAVAELLVILQDVRIIKLIGISCNMTNMRVWFADGEAKDTQTQEYSTCNL